MIDKIRFMILSNKLNKIVNRVESKGRIQEAYKKYMELLRQCTMIKNKKLRYMLESEILARIANICIYTGAIDQALEYSVKAINKARSSGNKYNISLALLMRAIALQSQDRYKEALEDIEEILRLSPRSPKEYEVKLWALILKSKIMIRLKDYRSAKKTLDEAVSDLHHAKKIKYILEELSHVKKELEKLLEKSM